MWRLILIFTASVLILAGCASSAPRQPDVILTTAPAEAMVPCDEIQEPGPTVGDLAVSYIGLAGNRRNVCSRLTDLQLFILSLEGSANQLKSTDKE